MKKIVNTYISKGLHTELCKERERLRKKEKLKKRNRKKITMYDASQSILRKVTK